MRKEDADKFIKEILQGLWPEWLPTTEEVRLWDYMLKHCDYEKSTIGIRNWFAAQEKQTRRPPFGKLRQVLRKIYQQTHRLKNSEPVLLYTIIKENKLDKSRGQRFYVGNESKIPKDQQIIRDDAERIRGNFNNIYGSNHVIVYTKVEQWPTN